MALAASAIALLPIPGAAGEEWLAGDLHVHTCYSHDAYCGPGDDNTGPEDLYTLSLPVGAQFLEASLRGLDFLAIADHNDVRSIVDPGFGSAGVTGIPAYENSLRGHAQMLGATGIYPQGDGSAGDVNGEAAALRATGGLFQINHPITAPGMVTDCNPTELDWGYGYDVVPDSLEVWNLATPGLPDATRWWECWLDRGARLPATGGSDSHWISTLAVQGVANPTTWVLSADRTPGGILAALNAGRTSVTRLAPMFGATPLVIEADAESDGDYAPATGADVAPGTPLRVTGGGPLGGFVRVRANDETILDDALLPPGGEVRFAAPAGDGWLRAELRFLPGALQQQLGCESVPDFRFAPCAGDQVMAALSSPIYARAPVPGPGPGPEPGGGAGAEAPFAATSTPTNSSTTKRCAKVKKGRACCALKRSRGARRKCRRLRHQRPRGR